jgi:hypothetical protein
MRVDDRGVAPVIPLRQTPDVKRGADKSPCCEHGDWRFAGAGHERKATKWRRPTILAKLSCGLARARAVPLAA